MKSRVTRGSTFSYHVCVVLLSLDVANSVPVRAQSSSLLAQGNDVSSAMAALTIGLVCEACVTLSCACDRCRHIAPTYCVYTCHMTEQCSVSFWYQALSDTSPETSSLVTMDKPGDTFHSNDFLLKDHTLKDTVHIVCLDIVSLQVILSVIELSCTHSLNLKNPSPCICLNIYLLSFIFFACFVLVFSYFPLFLNHIK